jgi:hypothetical protein
LFLRSGSPQHVYLLPQHPNFRLERGPRSKQINDQPNNEPNKISHPVTASPDSRSTASQIEFTTGTPYSSDIPANFADDDAAWEEGLNVCRDMILTIMDRLRDNPEWRLEITDGSGSIRHLFRLTAKAA